MKLIKKYKRKEIAEKKYKIELIHWDLFAGSFCAYEILTNFKIRYQWLKLFKSTKKVSLFKK